MRIAKKLSQNYLENENKQLNLNNLLNFNGAHNGNIPIPTGNNKENAAFLQNERKISKRS